MRVLITTDSYYPQVNGASYFAQRLAANLTRRGHELLVVAPSTTFGSGYVSVGGINVFGIRSVPVFFYKGMRVAFPPDLDGATSTALRDFRPDVVHAQGHFPISKALIGNAKRLGIPVVGTNHFMPENLTHYAHLPSRLDLRLRHWLWAQFRAVYEDLDQVTTPTNTAASFMKRNGFSREIRVISNGIDLDRFHPDGADDSVLRRTFGLPGVPLLLYVGRLDKEKNLDLVLRAMGRLPRNVPIHFAIAGTGACREKLEALVRHVELKDRVTFLGFVPDADIPALYRAAHCFMMAGTAELQSIATMEAMASGLPVLAVDAMALPELVHHGENGYLFARDDPEGLCARIQALFTDDGLRRRMGDASLVIIQKHALERTLEEFEAVYEDAIAPPAAPQDRSSYSTPDSLPKVDDVVQNGVGAPARLASEPFSGGLEIGRSAR